MSMKVIGAGVGRTGTHSLKVALEQVLGGPCYHMVEVFENPQHVPIWTAAANDRPVDWKGLLDGYHAAVDWPASAFYPELMEAYPDALVLLSERDPESWWKSASETIFASIGQPPPPERTEWFEMVKAMMTNRFTADLGNKDAAIEAYNRHNEKVRATVPKDRLLVWNAKEGWEPICERLCIPAPEHPFPLTNTTEEFKARIAPQAASS
jgi:sulfotransferase family protein